MSAQLILNFDSTEEFAKILQLLKDFGFENKIQVKKTVKKSKEPKSNPRQAGWGKGLFTNIAPDFDETPAGFEDYMLPTDK
jgi:hypothetical protein